MAIINRKTGLALVAAGDARIDGSVIHGDKLSEYIVITRFDRQTVDHFPLLEEDRPMLEALPPPTWARHLSKADV